MARRAKQLGQNVLQPLLEHGDHPGPHQRAPHLARATDHGHEQVFNADMQAKRGGIHKALQVGVQPAGGAGVQRGQHKNHHPRPRGVHPHRLGHHHAAFQRTDRPALAGVQQVFGGKQRHQYKCPHQVVVMPAIHQIDPEQGNRRQVGQAGMPPQEFHIAKQEVQRNAPGHGTQRQIVARQFQAERAQHQCHAGGQHQPKQQRQPRRPAGKRQPGRQFAGGGQPGGGVRPQTHKRRLTKTGQPAHPGKQHQAQRHQRRQANIIEQGDVKLRQQQRCQQQAQQKSAQHPARINPAGPRRGAAHLRRVFFNMVGGPRQPDQHRNNQGEHQHILEGTGPERRKRFQQAHHQRTRCRQRITGQPADNGGNKPLQANQETAVVVDGGDRRHQQTRQRANQRRHQKGLPPGQCRGNAHQPRAVAVDRGGAQRLAGQGAVKKQVQPDNQRQRSAHHHQGVSANHQAAQFNLGIAERRGARAFRAKDQQTQTHHHQMQRHRNNQQDQHRRFRHRLEHQAVQHWPHRHHNGQGQRHLDQHRQVGQRQPGQRPGQRQRVSQVPQCRAQ